MKSNDKIVFFLKGELVGSIELTPFSNTETRHELAFNAGVKEYDNFHLIKINDDGSETIRIDASTVSGIFGKDNADVHDMGKWEGEKYIEYLNNKSKQ
jgi:hypothetical protein